MNARFVRTYGATESFPPEDADLIVDNSATGSTLKATDNNCRLNYVVSRLILELQANGLTVIDVVLKSSTRLYASRAAYDNPKKRAEMNNLVMLLQSVLGSLNKSLSSSCLTMSWCRCT